MMALTLGTDAYIELATYKAWADARGYTYGTDAEVEAAIVLATDFIDQNYTFLGDPVSESQDLQLPTDEVTIADIEKGAAQATYLQTQGRLLVDPADISQQGQIASESSSVGSLSESIEYRGGYITTYPTTSIDRALQGYIVSGGLGVSRRW